MTGRRVAGLLLAGLLGLPLAACGSEDDRTTTSPVIVPAGPGEPATTLPPGSEFPQTQDPWAPADAEFVVGMVPHHEQALELAALAPGRAEHPTVLGLASRISDVQGAEIAVYERWLADRGMARDGGPASARDANGHGAEGHGGDADGGGGHAMMPGMASEADVRRLAALTGTEFDRLWLQLMVAHHEGALEMVDRRIAGGGVDVRADELADDVNVTQLDEIATMRAVLEQLPA